MKIMIVDDSRAVHSFVKDCLMKTGITEFVDAFNGAEAIALLHNDVDLVLLDWEMPVQNGPETLRLIRSKGIETPVIMMTSKNALDNVTQMLDLGANDYIMKPFTADTIHEKLELIRAVS